MIDLGLIALAIGLCWLLSPKRVRRWWLRRVAAHGNNPEQRARAARLLRMDTNGDLHS